MSQGVYAIFIPFTGSKTVCYVGSTVKSFASRFSEHLVALGNNNHSNRRLQRAYNAAQGRAVFKIIEKTSMRQSIEEVRKREQYYINKLSTIESLRVVNVLPTNVTFNSRKAVNKYLKSKQKVLR